MAEKVLMKGNEALGEAAIRAGCRYYFGYPITPQSELLEFMASNLPKRGGVFVQSESEIAGISMVYGAAASGMRAMTSSSSPGVSLMQEGISYLASSELPAVIVNVSRGGPGLGRITPAQSDYFQATKGGGHGDYHLLVLSPASVQEMADLVTLAFELGDKIKHTEYTCVYMESRHSNSHNRLKIYNYKLILLFYKS
jgi:2-oxoglutarate ferredoxin oxidoreductase subunit alpha